MARQESLEDEPWLLIEPDPGSFSQLCFSMGVQGVQVEQIHSLNRGVFQDLRPIHGITLLVHHKPEKTHREDAYGTNSSHPSVYFANQTVHDAYAMYALLSVLMNRTGLIDLGAELNHIKNFSGEFPPTLKGLSLTNSKVLKDAHNSIARRRPRRIVHRDEIYHYITYIPVGGYLWELDGFKRGPIRLASCTETNWIDAARSELQRKIDIVVLIQDIMRQTHPFVYGRFQRQQVPFSVWSVNEDRRRVHERQLAGRAYIKDAIERQLDSQDPSWRAVIQAQQWEDEYRHAMNAERCKRETGIHPIYTYSRSIDELPEHERAKLQKELGTSVQGRSTQELMDLWLQAQGDSLKIYSCLNDEIEKHQKYERDMIRRQHDYTPFIKAYISCLVAGGHLQRIVKEYS